MCWLFNFLLLLDLVIHHTLSTLNTVGIGLLFRCNQTS